MDVTQLAFLAPKPAQPGRASGAESEEPAFSEAFDAVSEGEAAGGRPTDKAIRNDPPETTDKEPGEALPVIADALSSTGQNADPMDTSTLVILPVLKTLSSFENLASANEATTTPELQNNRPETNPVRNAPSSQILGTSDGHADGPPKLTMTPSDALTAGSVDRQVSAAANKNVLPTETPLPTIDPPKLVSAGGADTVQQGAAVALPAPTGNEQPIQDASARATEAPAGIENMFPSGDVQDLTTAPLIQRRIQPDLTEPSQPVAGPLRQASSQPAKQLEVQKPEQPDATAPREGEGQELMSEAATPDVSPAPKPPPLMATPAPTAAVPVDLLPASVDPAPDPMIAEISGHDPTRGEAARSAGIEQQIIHRPETPRLIAQQVADVIRTAKDGTLEVTLRPEELGRLSLTFNGDGSTLSVSLSADRPETLDLLKRNLTLLERDLRDLGYGALDFTFEGGDRHEGKPDTRADLRALAGPSAVMETEPDMGRPLPAIRSGGGVDLRL